jgi:hypothetical protein
MKKILSLFLFILMASAGLAEAVPFASCGMPMGPMSLSVAQMAFMSTPKHACCDPGACDCSIQTSSSRSSALVPAIFSWQKTSSFDFQTLANHLTETLEVHGLLSGTDESPPSAQTPLYKLHSNYRL